MTRPPPLSERIAALEHEVAELPRLKADLEALQERIYSAEDARAQLGLIELQLDPELDGASRHALAVFLMDGTYFENQEHFLPGPRMFDLTRLARVRQLRDGAYTFVFDPCKGTRRGGAGPLREVTLWRDAGEARDAIHEAAEISTSEPAPSAPPAPREGAADPHEEAGAPVAESSASEPAPSAEEPPAAPDGEQQEGTDASAPVPPPSNAHRLLLALRDGPLTVTELGRRLGLSGRSLASVIGGLVRQRRILRDGERYRLPDPTPTPPATPEPSVAPPAPVTAATPPTSMRDRVRAYFEADPERVATPQELQRVLRIPRSTLQRQLVALVAAGVLVLVVPGGQGGGGQYRARQPEKAAEAEAPAAPEGQGSPAPEPRPEPATPAPEASTAEDASPSPPDVPPANPDEDDRATRESITCRKAIVALFAEHTGPYTVAEIGDLIGRDVRSRDVLFNDLVVRGVLEREGHWPVRYRRGDAPLRPVAPLPPLPANLTVDERAVLDVLRRDARGLTRGVIASRLNWNYGRVDGLLGKLLQRELILKAFDRYVVPTEGVSA